MYDGLLADYAVASEQRYLRTTVHPAVARKAVWAREQELQEAKAPRPQRRSFVRWLGELLGRTVERMGTADPAMHMWL